jgi:hypothetical protein
MTGTQNVVVVVVVVVLETRMVDMMMGCCILRVVVSQMVDMLMVVVEMLMMMVEMMMRTHSDDDGSFKLRAKEMRRTKRGRPSSTQIRTEMDEFTKQPIKYGLCGQLGHNRSKCPNIGGPSIQH